MIRARTSTAGFIVTGLVLVLSACDKDEKQNGQPVAAPSASAPTRATTDHRHAIAEGDAVVVESGDATYWEGKVVKVESEQVTYEYGTNRSTGEAPRDRVYVVTQGHRTVAQEGDVAICKTGPASWNPCEVKRVADATYMAEDASGKTHTLSASEIVVPNEGGKARLLERFEAASKHRDFLRAARSAGPPRRPDGWTPKPGDEVVAKFTDASWYGGRIRRLTPHRIHIAWDDKSAPSERDYGEVAPKPETASEVEVGEYVLGRPRRGTRWDYYHVESVDDTGVLLVDKDGRKRRVRKSDVIPLGT